MTRLSHSSADVEPKWLRAMRILVLGALVLQVAWSGIVNGRESLRSVAAFRSLRHETAVEARRRVLGDSYARALEQIEATVPLDGAYVLLDLDANATAIVLQGELAPRRALLVTGTSGLRNRPRTPRHARWPETAVVYRGFGVPPEVVPVEDLARKRRR